MRILFVSGELTGSGLCQKLISEGNDVRLYILRDDWKDCYTNITTKVEEWKEELEWVGKDGLIVFDDVVFGEEQELLRSLGYSVVGGSRGGDLLELDRKLFQDIALAHGLHVLPSYNFQSATDALHFVKANPDRWVIKQNTHLSSLNFVSSTSDGSDTISTLERYEHLNISPVYIQKFVSGIEIGVARYFNGDDWVGPIEVNHEHKRLSEGDVGPLTPEMGTILWYTDEEIPLFRETLGKFKPYLQKIDFRGDFDINFIVNEEGIWPIEATPRFGAPSTQIQIALHKSPWTEFLSAVAKKKPYKLDYRKGYGIAVSVVVPPFPYTPKELSVQPSAPERFIKLSDDLTEEDRENIHFEEVSLVDGKYHWSGNAGLVLHVTAHADTIQAAKKIAYDRVSKIQLANMYYRKDIGDRVADTDIPQLRDWGWL